MREVLELSVSQMRIFAPDRIPYSLLRTQGPINVLREAFGFQAVQVEPTTGANVVFINGSFDVQGRTCPVVQVQVEERRVTVSLVGSSSTADAFNRAFWAIVSRATHSEDLSDLEPLVKSETTNCVATLDIDFSELLSVAMVDFLAGAAIDTLATKHSKPRTITLRSLAFDIRYTASTPLEDYGLAVAPKVLTIEPRAGSSLRDRRFFVSSPTDSDAHLLFLEQLESAVLAARTHSDSHDRERS